MNKTEILETINMIREHHLDIRTITMGVSLLDCVGKDGSATAKKVYEKVVSSAKDLVATGRKISAMYGIPIVNKRVSVTPISLVGATHRNYHELALALDKSAKEIGVDFIGGFSALVHKGITDYEQEFLNAIPKALASTDKVCSSVNVASTRAGINMDAVKQMGKTIKDLALLTKDNNSIGCAKFVVFANAVEDNPFMAGAFHGVGEGDNIINVGVSGPGVVKTALEKVRGKDLGEVCEVIKKTAFRVTRAGQLVAQTACKMLGKEFGIVDLSLAPTPAMGDSVAHILEEIGLSTVGGPGTTAVLALLNDAVKKGGIMASSHVGGLSGAFIPVSEDIGMINSAKSGALTLEKLEAMTAVCSVGLDMIAIPGDTSAETISAIIADEASIGVINNKTTAVRLIPAFGKKVGDEIVFGGLLGSAPIMPVSALDASEFINRGGRIPAPLHSNRN
ncbi:MAG: PFL family protein [Firmicutes bacterium]|nr:PFL family protein [Bacillota bacterium]